jgi:hypothetical protein
MFSERSKTMKKQKGRFPRATALVLAAFFAVTAALGAQEGLTFGGSVITGLRYRSYVGGEDNVFDIDAGDDYLVEGDTASLRATLNQGTYGASFALSLNANNTQAAFWTPDRLYVSEASLWAKILNNKLQVKAGYFGDFDYFSPVNAWSLAGGPASNATQLTVYPIEGLQIDVRTKNSASNIGGFSNPGAWSAANWYHGEEFLRNIDAGVRYANPSFTAWVAFDDSSTASTPTGTPPTLKPGTSDETDKDNWATPGTTGEAVYQTDVFGYFAFTGVPKLSVAVETKFLDLTTERKGPNPVDANGNLVRDDNDELVPGEDIGITNITALNASYQITDALSARLWLVAGAATDGIIMTSYALLENDDGFTFTADLEGTYKLNDALTFYLRPIFAIPNTKDADIFVFSVRPKVSWAIAPMPYAATINLWYKLRAYGDKTVEYANNNKKALSHTVACTFGWSF